MRNIVSTTIAFVLIAPAARPNVVTVLAQKDNTMYAEGQESNGAGDFFFAGNAGTGETRRALVQFDVAAVIPAGSTINSAQLVLYMSKTTAQPCIVELHRLLASWGEGPSDAFNGEGAGVAAAPNDATWTDRFYPGSLWSTPGGEFVASASATRLIGGVGSYTWSTTPALVADVQSWVSSPASNNGWLLLNVDEIVVPTAKRFNSRTHPNASQRPRLVVDFTPPVAPVAHCFGDGSGSACPCANAGAAGNGCANSIDANGANIAASGIASLVADSLVLDGTGMPDSSALYFQGTAQVGGGAGVAFGDGLRCVAGTVIRLGTETNSAGASHHPSGTDLPISLKGAIPAAGTVRRYQCWYRNATAYCTPETFNYTNGLTVTWSG